MQSIFSSSNLVPLTLIPSVPLILSIHGRSEFFSFNLTVIVIYLISRSYYFRRTVTRMVVSSAQNQYTNCAKYPLVWTLSRTDTYPHLITPTECYARFLGSYFSLKRCHHEFFLHAVPLIPQICKESSSSDDRHVLEEII